VDEKGHPQEGQEEVLSPDNEHTVTEGEAGERIDLLLKRLEPGCSRSVLQKLLRSGLATINGATVSPGHRVRAGDGVAYRLPELREEPPPEDIALSILHEDDSVIVLDKPAGLTVHPVRAGQGGTLVSALLVHTSDLSDVGGPLRRGIVHRLDRDTSGVMVAAKTNAAHGELSRQFKKRLVIKEYRAIVERAPELDADRVLMTVGRHDRHPRRMAATRDGGKSAETEYRVLERLGRFALVLARPRTGRTHQIRLLFSEMGHPIAGDSAYGAKKVLRRKDLLDDADGPDDAVLSRQALHSASLEFAHPDSGERLRFEAPLPPDMAEVLRLLRGSKSRV
jgi:23S rRNA pseudouridine1911/1915/1917 synthase